MVVDQRYAPRRCLTEPLAGRTLRKLGRERHETGVRSISGRRLLNAEAMQDVVTGERVYMGKGEVARYLQRNADGTHRLIRF